MDIMIKFLYHILIKQPFVSIEEKKNNSQKRNLFIYHLLKAFINVRKMYTQLGIRK